MDTQTNTFQKQHVVVFGTGSFGTALATTAARAGHDVTIVGRTVEIITKLTKNIQVLNILVIYQFQKILKH